MDLILFILASAGLTQIIVFSKIAEIPRNYLSQKSEILKYLLGCCMCTGLWAGIAIFIIGCLSNLFKYPLNLGTMLMFGCISSLTSYIFCVLFGDKGLNINRNNGNV